MSYDTNSLKFGDSSKHLGIMNFTPVPLDKYLHIRQFLDTIYLILGNDTLLEKIFACTNFCDFSFAVFLRIQEYVNQKRL